MGEGQWSQRKTRQRHKDREIRVDIIGEGETGNDTDRLINVLTALKQLSSVKTTFKQVLLAAIITLIHTDHQKTPSKCIYNVNDGDQNPQFLFLSGKFLEDTIRPLKSE